MQAAARDPAAIPAQGLAGSHGAARSCAPLPCHACPLQRVCPLLCAPVDASFIRLMPWCTPLKRTTQMHRLDTPLKRAAAPAAGLPVPGRGALDRRAGPRRARRVRAAGRGPRRRGRHDGHLHQVFRLLRRLHRRLRAAHPVPALPLPRPPLRHRNVAAGGCPCTLHVCLPAPCARLGLACAQPWMLYTHCLALTTCLTGTDAALGMLEPVHSPPLAPTNTSPPPPAPRAAAPPQKGNKAKNKLKTHTHLSPLTHP
jgi:hypothetical protein